MSVISLLILLVILGVVFYCIDLIPMSAPFPVIIKVVAIVVAIVLLLQFFGFYTGMSLHV